MVHDLPRHRSCLNLQAFGTPGFGHLSHFPFAYSTAHLKLGGFSNMWCRPDFESLSKSPRCPKDLPDLGGLSTGCISLLQLIGVKVLMQARADQTREA